MFFYVYSGEFEILSYFELFCISAKYFLQLFSISAALINRGFVNILALYTFNTFFLKTW